MITSCGPRTLIAKTCITCGELLMARFFSKINGIYHNSTCQICNNREYRKRTHQNQSQTLSAAEKHRQPWTDEDLDRLSEMVSEGRTTAQIAMNLKRSAYSVNTMRNKLKRGIV